MSMTPRTDSEIIQFYRDGYVAAEFARTLEREPATERARGEKTRTALKDAISTYFGADKLVTAERIEAWQAAL